MGIASYHRVYRRALPTGEAACLRNLACRLTDHGADPDPGDLAWCIRRAWRVIHWGSTPTLNRAVVLAGRACVLQKSRMTIEQGLPGAARDGVERSAPGRQILFVHRRALNKMEFR